MITLSYGYQKPQTNDRGPQVFPALEANWQRVNDHTHNGVNSAKLTSSSFDVVTQTILAANWQLISGGHYKQTVTLPGTLEFDKLKVEVRTVAGAVVHPTIEKVSTTTFDVFFDDPTQNLVMVY